MSFLTCQIVLVKKLANRCFVKAKEGNRVDKVYAVFVVSLQMWLTKITEVAQETLKTIWKCIHSMRLWSMWFMLGIEVLGFWRIDGRGSCGIELGIMKNWWGKML